MNTQDPSTWLDISASFDANAYDGDMDADLALLRSGALHILNAFPSYSCELVVLDDLTMYVRITEAASTVAELCTSTADDGQPCYFIALLRPTNEIRVKTVEEVIEVLRKASSAW